MLRIDRYISFLFWGYFLGGLLVFVTIFIGFDAMSTMVNYKGVATGSLLTYYGYMAPEIMNKMLPVSCLIGVVLTLSNMNRASELVALFASGMSLLRVSASMLAWVCVICVASYIVSDHVLPVTTREKNYIFANEIERKPGHFAIVKTDKIWYKSKNTIFNIKTLNPETAKAQGLTMYFFTENWDLVQMISAASVTLNGKTWLLDDGSVTLFSGESSFPMTSTFKEKTLPMGEDQQDLTASAQTAEILSQGELNKFIHKNKEAGLDTISYEVDYQAKFGFAAAGLVMVLLGIPFSVSRTRSGGMMLNLGICIALVFGYWVLYSSSLTLGNHGTLPPFLAAWLPNIVMGSLGIYLLRRLNR